MTDSTAQQASILWTTACNLDITSCISDNFASLLRESSEAAHLSVGDCDEIAACLGALAFTKAPQLRLEEANLISRTAGADIYDLNMYICAFVSHLKHALLGFYGSKHES